MCGDPDYTVWLFNGEMKNLYVTDIKSLPYNQVKDFSVEYRNLGTIHHIIKQFVNLEVLSIVDCTIPDNFDLSIYKNLKQLYISMDVGVRHDDSRSKTFNIECCRELDFIGLSFFEKMAILNINFSKFSKLTTLDITYNGLDKLPFLNGCLNLEELDCETNEIVDFGYDNMAPLELPKLRKIKVNNNKLVALPDLTLLPSLQEIQCLNNNFETPPPSNVGNATVIWRLF